MLALKRYQQATLATLQNYLATARFAGVDAAYRQWGNGPYQRLGDLYSPLYDLPYVCLRLPTGGGKTLLAAHSIALAAQAYLHQETPLVLWLTPSNAIRTQTLATLRNPQHPNRQALDAAFVGRVLVLDIAEFEQLRPHDRQQRTCIIVGTLQTLRVTSTEGRRVYAHNENLEPHFSGVRADHPHLQVVDERAKPPQIRYSFANLLALHHPLVIIDEAHNATSKLSVEVLERIRPACILEYTATPAENSNVLHSVSASELKEEEMIKLPIILTDTPNWQEALHNSILMRNQLQTQADLEREFIHPVVLIQAEDKGKEVTVDVIKHYLLAEERLHPEQIAIATGEQRELEGVNLLDPQNRVEFIITKDALKEGWDCPFAYVFCSVATVHSARDVEQLLGRVLRMPYARQRKHKALNQAYAFVSASSWPQAVGQLRDRLVAMGFDPLEANQSIRPQLSLFAEEALPVAHTEPPLRFYLSEAPDLTLLASAEQAQVTVIEHSAQRVELRVTGPISDGLAQKLEAVAQPQELAGLRATLAVHRQQQAQRRSPAERGETITIPLLSLHIAGAWEQAEPELFVPLNGINLLDHSARLNEREFAIQLEAHSYAFDINGKRLEARIVREQSPLELDWKDTHWSDLYLSRWLTNRLRHQHFKDEVLLEFVRNAVEHLHHTRNLALVDIARARYGLEAALRARLDTIRQATYQSNFQRLLLDNPSGAVQTNYEYTFRFDPQATLPPPYDTRGMKFQYHLYPLVPALDTDDEFECAQVLEALCLQGKLKHWVRNPVRSENSFRLPLADGNFYPDFVAETRDGRIFVLEFKGDHLLHDPRTRQKQNVGELWAEKSGGKGIFLMAVQKDRYGQGVSLQIANALKA